MDLREMTNKLLKKGGPPAAEQIRMLKAPGKEICLARLIKPGEISPMGKYATWLVERLDTGSQDRVRFSYMGRAMTEMEVLAWISK